jgi:hypothetical protein
MYSMARSQNTIGTGKQPHLRARIMPLCSWVSHRYDRDTGGVPPAIWNLLQPRHILTCRFILSHHHVLKVTYAFAGNFRVVRRFGPCCCCAQSVGENDVAAWKRPWVRGQASTG